MGKIKQGILGGFKGKVGTVIGASWNGIAYMKGLPQSQKDPKTAAQMAQRNYFREIQGLAGQLTAEQLASLYPSVTSGRTRRNMLVHQLAAAAAIVDDVKTVDLSQMEGIGSGERIESLIPGLGRSPGEGKATHSSILVWRIPVVSHSMQSHGLYSP